MDNSAKYWLCVLFLIGTGMIMGQFAAVSVAAMAGAAIAARRALPEVFSLDHSVGR